MTELVTSGSVGGWPVMAVSTRKPHPNVWGVPSLLECSASTSCIFIGSVTIKAKATYCYFQQPRKQRIVLTDQLAAKNAWVGC